MIEVLIIVWEIIWATLALTVIFIGESSLGLVGLLADMVAAVLIISLWVGLLFLVVGIVVSLVVVLGELPKWWKKLRIVRNK